jgi:predicted amino acid dehydrogenase
MKRILVIHLGKEAEDFTATLGARQVQVLWRGCTRNSELARRLVAEHDGQVDAIALDGIPIHLELGRAHRFYKPGRELSELAKETPVVDGSGVRAGLERWAVTLADRAEPGVLSQKRVLMCPGVNHVGLAQAIGRKSPQVHYYDPEIFFRLPDVFGVGRPETLETADAPTLDLLRDASLDRVSPPPIPRNRPATSHIRWADMLAGDVATIRNIAPPKLQGKTVVVPYANAEDVDDLRGRGVAILVTLLPSLTGKHDEMARHSAAVIEACFVALREDPNAPLTEDSYLDLMADIQWSPKVTYLQDEDKINRFAFVIHPLSVEFIHRAKGFEITRYLPDRVVEETAARLKPMYVGKITAGPSPETGQRIEGYLYGLGATPRQMMKRDPRFIYDQLAEAAKMAERKGCRIMGLGAFTSVVGDAGETVAHEASIAITSGNSLTVAATLEAAKQAVINMGATQLKKGRAMVIGATGSIGSVCARLLAQAVHDVVLVSIEPEKLIDLKRTIEKETPGTDVQIALRPNELAGDCDLIVTATSAFGQRILDISTCKPGAVVCDVARPPDISSREAELRPDVAVIESGEVIISGEVDIGVDIGLPPGTAYACLAETALLAMEGRFESFTLGRNIDIDRVKEIYRLFNKHQFKIAGLRSFDHLLTPQDFADKRAEAQKLRDDPELLEHTRAEVRRKIAEMPVTSKGIPASDGPLRTVFKRVSDTAESLAENIGPVAQLLEKIRSMRSDQQL